MSELLKIGKSNIESTLKENDVVVIDFWASWCGPCRMLTPVFEKLAEDYEANSNVVFGKLNVDDENALAVKYGVMTIPTVIIFKNGEEMRREVGFKPKEHYAKIINELI